MDQARGLRGALAVFLAGLGTSWGAGDVGPVVNELTREFDISLTTVGLLAGTVFFLAMIGGLLAAPKTAERIGLGATLRVGCAVAALGSLVFALGIGVAGLGVGRVLAGIGLGIVAVLGPVYGRATGGVARVGLFGAAFQLGIAVGLGLGSVFNDLGLDWRAGFLAKAVVVTCAIPFIQTDIGVELERGRSGFLRAALGKSRVWRLGLLFMAMFTIPLTLGAWFVHYLTEDGLNASVAGGFAFVLFGASALLRELGGRLRSRGVSPVLLAGTMPWLAAVGLALIGLDQSLEVALAAVLLMAAGFALPYASMMLEAQQLFPPEPAQPTALLTLIGTGISIATVPVLGAALAAGDGAEAFLVMAAFVVVAGIANLKPAGEPVVED